MEPTKPLPCSEKIAYNSEKEARAGIAASSYHYKKPELKVYKCRDCGLFHVTTVRD